MQFLSENWFYTNIFQYNSFCLPNNQTNWFHRKKRHRKQWIFCPVWSCLRFFCIANHIFFFNYYSQLPLLLSENCMVMETGVPAKKDCLLFVHIGIQSNRLPEILEVSVMHFSKQFHVSSGGTSGGNICKTPNKTLLFCCTHCFVGVNNISQNDKKIFLILQKFAVRGNEWESQ